MYTDVKVLDLLFRQTSAERILSRLVERIRFSEVGFWGNNKNNDKELFLDYSESTLHGYSKDEQELLYSQLKQASEQWNKNHYPVEGFLVPILQFAEKVLIVRGNTPYCRIDKIFDWREAFLALGQDIFVCADLAYYDYTQHISRKDFSWPSIIPVENNELRHVLEKGIADNHNHIKGGTASFQISWSRLMNYPDVIPSELKNFYHSQPLFDKLSRTSGDRSLDLVEQLQLAALIRSILFRALHRPAFIIDNEDDDDEEFSGMRAFQKEYCDAFSRSTQLGFMVDCLRNSYGAKLDYPTESDFCLDYVLSDELLGECVDSNVRSLVGERAFLYSCVKACIGTDEFDDFEKQLFLLYLVLKSSFRSEMIQANSHVGFQNFAEYQDRKDNAWEENAYFWEAIRIAINHPLQDESVSSLEARLIPKPNPNVDISRAYDMDLAKRFADCVNSKILDVEQYEFDRDLADELFKDAPYFFLFHFPKIRDSRKLQRNKFTDKVCRHQKERELYKNMAKGLGEALCKSAYLRSRVRGIDAAASELAARPEVFAVVYRYLQLIEKRWNGNLGGFNRSSAIRLGITYHAGEDFYDIADGLRAIDETIELLDLPLGSRIGHALALGVEPVHHYQTKHREIVTTQQNRLDDLVWILYRSKELGIIIKPAFEEKLRREALSLFRKIYGNAMRANNWDFNLDFYYWSMKLRGDDPELYREADEFDPNQEGVRKWCIREPYMFDAEMGECQKRTSDPVLDEFRKEKNIVGLFYYYQFGVEEGIVGNETYTCPVDADYMDLMRELQDAMMVYVNQKQISIECNPSSNVLIGTFKKYERHPIFRFNNRVLAQASGKPNPVQLLVSINTDDLGVFDTSLEFEYALIYQALKIIQETQSEGSFDDRTIIEYLQDIRRMGIRSTFPDNQ